FTSWSASGLSNKRVNSLGASGETIVAGAPSEIFRSTDRGATWTPDSFGFPVFAPSAIAFAAAGDEVFFAGTEMSGVYASAGRTWLDTAGLSGNLLLGKRVFSLAINRQFVFAGSDGFGVFRREVAPRQCCAVWTPANAGLANLTIKSLAIKGDHVFAGTLGGGIFISTNNGASWSTSSQGLPADAEIRALAVSDNPIFAALSNGIYRSTDNGSNWTRLSNGLPASLNANSLLAHGPNIVAGGPGGVHLSTDDGASWRPINQGLTNQEVLSLVAGASKLYAGTTAGVFATTIIPAVNQPPVAQSKNVTTDEDTPLMIRLEASDADGNPLQYQVTTEPLHGALIQSGANVTYIPNHNFNEGDEFTFRAFDSQIGSREAKVRIEIKPVNDPPQVEVSGDRLVIAGQFVPLYVLVSDPDPGQQPTLTANNLPAGARFDPQNRIFTWVPDAAGSYTFSFTATDDANPPLSDTETVTVRVADNPEKAAWSQISAPNNLPVYSVLADGNDIYAATGFPFPTEPPADPPRLFKSVDQGANWTPADAGLTGFVQSIARSGAALFAGASDNVYRSTDNGATWVSVSSGLPRRDNGTPTPSLELMALTTTADKVLVATATGIFSSTNQGAQWTNITGDLPYTPPSGPIHFSQARISSLAVAGDALFASVQYLPRFFSAAPVAELQSPGEPAAELALEPPRFGVFRTTNNGMNWVAVNNGLRDPLSRQTVVIVHQVKASGARLYAMTSAGLFFSNNQGASWTSINSNLTETIGSFIGFSGLFAVDRDNLYLSLSSYGLYLSRNNGAEWLPINLGLTEGYLGSFAVSGSKLFASAGAGKLFVRPAT
ncbi:MAG: Ig-like domain-containing protein, partial [Blastocatellia bacterium]